MGVVDKGAKAAVKGKEAAVKGFNSLKKALKLSDDLPLERAAEAADPAVLNKVDELLAGQGIDPKSIGTYEDKIKTLITKPDAYAEYRKTLNEVYGKGDSRSSEAGFGKQDWFHGTTVPIDEFKNEALGLSTGAQSAKKGFFFAGDAPTAGNYADLAADKGVIREGDKITTRALSETADLHNEAYDKAKDLQFEISTAIENNMRQGERNHNTWKLIRQIEQRADPQEMAERLPELKEKIKKGDAFIEANELKSNQLANEIKSINDKIYSQGQNVLPVKLRAGDGKVHVKDYKGQGYRDTTYADEMTKAQEKGNSGVLFKNTYDPADPNNRVQQNIAAVFNPEQIRSKFAAFDPALNKSKWIMAGTAGAALTMRPEESEASMSKYDNLRKMIKMGDIGFDTAQDGADTIIKLPGDKTFNVTSDKGDSLQMAQDLVYGRKPVTGGEPGKIAPTEDVAGAMERSLEQTDVGIPNKAGFNQAPQQKNAFEKTMHAISAPQRYVMDKAAGALGVQGDKENSEKSAQNIVEGLANRMGIPEDSTLGNAAKAGAVAGLEVFGDPLGVLPVGKAASLVGKAKKSAYPALKRMFSVGNTKFPASNAAEAMKVKDALVQSGKESSEAVIRDLERN